MTGHMHAYVSADTVPPVRVLPSGRVAHSGVCVNLPTTRCRSRLDDRVDEERDTRTREASTLSDPPPAHSGNPLQPPPTPDSDQQRSGPAPARLRIGAAGRGHLRRCPALLLPC